jgi:hypothetical protein
MRHQERIYIQNDNRAVRNKDVLNVNMSSDFGIFKSPLFDISGATKVPCGYVTCDLSGVSLDNIFTAAAAICLTATTTVVNTFLSADWYTKIYEDNVLTYSGSFYTSTFSGDTPSNTLFLTSISNGLDILNYEYTQDGTEFTIQKPYGGAKEIEFDVCISFDMNRFTCPAGYSATPANDQCQQINISAATFSVSGSPIVAGNVGDGSYTAYGAYFYPNVLNNGALPLYYDASGIYLKDQTGGTINAININTTSTFLSNPGGGTVNGRLINAGLSAATNQWVGFSKCLDIAEAGTYYIGMAADNDCRFKVNGTLIVSFTGAVAENFRTWSVFPVDLLSGKNIIEMEGKDLGTYSAFAAEVYDPINYQTLTAATSSAMTNTIFTTKEYLGKTWDLGTTVGYSCSAGYVLDTCNSTAYTCTQILNTGITSTTAQCLDNCVIACNHDFPYVDNSTLGVYQIDPAVTTTIPLTFNFTGNTSSFLLNNASFKYEVYKYNNDLGIFSVPPVYKSDIIPYTSFTTTGATSTLNTSIPVSGLQLDGQYVIKGFYVTDAITPFLKKLGKKLDTTTYLQNGEYQLYDKNLDYYLVATTTADTPKFVNQIVSTGGTFYESTPLYQQVIIVDDAIYNNRGTTPDNTPVVGTGNTYYRTGSIFTLQKNYIGDVVVTLNGLTLSKNIDYTLQGKILTMLGPITNGDVITIIYTSTLAQTIVSEPILLNSTIPSGTTNNQGSNKYYYNTTTNKYEVYLNNDPVDYTNIIVVLNGITLINNIDYYQSVSNKKRIILNGSLMVGDIITMIYYPAATVINGITQNSNNILWYIKNGPDGIDGDFTLEYSKYSNFTTYDTNAIIPYQKYLTNYNSVLSLTGDSGTNYYYRVKNVKRLTTVCGDLITSTAYSETVKVVIQSNAINSY